MADKEAMTEEDLEKTFGQMVEQAYAFSDSEISGEREKATEYYNGELFGDEVDGRSQVVSRDVRDTVQQMLPPLVKIFYGGENVLEFDPEGPEDVQIAEQATDYVNYILQRDNPGFQIFYAAFKDALIRKTGIFKTWYEEKEEVTGAEYTGLDEQTLALLMQEPGIEEQQISQDPTTGLFDVQVKRKAKTGRVRVAVIPPEEFIINDSAKNETDAILIGHKTRKTRSDLIELGYDPDVIDESGGEDDELESNTEIQARRNKLTYIEDEGDDSVKHFTYVEGYIRIDFDGDGIAELRKVCAIGSQMKVVSNEPWDEPGIAVICPDPEYYTLFGDSIADVTMDVQRIKSKLLRSMLDNLDLTNFPRTGVLEGQANMDDVLNTEIGGVVRMKRPDALFPIETQFVAGQAFPMLEYFDQIKEQRTGLNKAAVGLEPDALQSTTRAAANAMVTASKERVELIARIFAETGIKRLYRMILRLVVKHQDQPRMIRLRNQFVQMDPRQWNADMDMTVNAGLGGGTTEEKLATLSQIAQRQESILQVAGPNNPLVSMKNYYNTLTKALELSGFKDVSSFFTDPDTYQAPPQPQQPSDPAVMIAQIEAEKVKQKAQSDARDAQIKAQTDQAKIEQDREQMMLNAQIQRERMQLDREKMNADIRIAEMTLQTKQIEVGIKQRDADRKDFEAANPSPGPN